MTLEKRKNDCKKCEYCDMEYLKDNSEGCVRFWLNRDLDCCDAFRKKSEELNNDL